MNIETRIIGGQKVPYLKDEVEVFKNDELGFKVKALKNMMGVFI